MSYLWDFLDGVCARALPAAVFEALLVAPLLSTFDAALAARAEVTFCAFVFAIMIHLRSYVMTGLYNICVNWSLKYNM